MSAASDYLENALLDHVMRNTALTSPTAVYLGLATATFADDNSGTELSGNGYARQAITCSAASGGSITNSSAISSDSDRQLGDGYTLASLTRLPLGTSFFTGRSHPPRQSHRATS